MINLILQQILFISCNTDLYSDDIQINGIGINQIYKDLQVQDKDGIIKINKTLFRNTKEKHKGIYNRIYFVPLTEKDKDFFFFLNSGSTGTVMFHNYNQRFNKEQEQEYIKYIFQDKLKQKRPYNTYVIYLENMKIGLFHLYRMEDIQSISYAITIAPKSDNRKIQNQGYGTVALEKIIDFIIYLNAQGEINFKYIEALVSTENHASMIINANNGFKVISKGGYRNAGNAIIYKLILRK